MKFAASITTLCLLLQAAPPSRLLPLNEVSFPATVAAKKGKVLLVNFWATWCEPCRKEMPALAKMAASLKPKGLEFVTISADEPEDEKSALFFLAKVGISDPVYAKRPKNDDQFINSIDAKWTGALPALILYDKSGKKVKTWIGETELKDLEAEIRKLL